MITALKEPMQETVSRFPDAKDYHQNFGLSIRLNEKLQDELKKSHLPTREAN